VSLGRRDLIVQQLGSIRSRLFRRGVAGGRGASVRIGIAFTSLLQQARNGEHGRGHEDESCHECDRKQRAFHGVPPYSIEMDKTVSSKPTITWFIGLCQGAKTGDGA